MNEVDKRFDELVIDMSKRRPSDSETADEVKSFIHEEIKRALEEVFGKIIVNNALIPNQIYIMRKEDYHRLLLNLKKYLEEK